MTELDMAADVESEDFGDELSDEALDREEGSFVRFSPTMHCGS